MSGVGTAQIVMGKQVGSRALIFGILCCGCVGERRPPLLPSPPSTDIVLDYYCPCPPTSLRTVTFTELAFGVPHWCALGPYSLPAFVARMRGTGPATMGRGGTT